MRSLSAVQTRFWRSNHRKNLHLDGAHTCQTVLGYREDAPPSNCIKYAWLPATKAFDIANPNGGGWPYQTQQACDVVNWDSVGVFIKLNHKYITNLFGTSITLTDHAVFRLEPAPTQACSGP